MTYRYAGIASRAIGRAVDLAVLAFLVAGTSWLVAQFLGVDPAHCPTADEWWHLRARLCGLMPYAVPAAGVVIPPLYRVLFYVVAGQTPGMAIVGLRLLRGNGKRVGLRQAVKRIGIFYLTLGLGSLLIPVSSRRRALHDIVAGTVVVYDWGSNELDVGRAIEQLESSDA
jgi:uncharacterized RDD family membrane protein YckC